MPTLPDSRSLGSRPIPQSRQGVTRIQTGQVEQAAGQLGKQVADTAMEFKRLDDIEKVSKAMTDFEDKQRQFLVEGDDAVLNRTGDNAKGALQTTEQWWEETGNRYVADLENPDQQRAFQEMLRRQRSSVLNSVAKHETQQRKVSFANTLDARMSTATERAAAMPGDMEVNKQSRAEVADALNLLAKTQGWSPEVRETKTLETMTKFHGRQIGAMIDNDPEAAAAYFEQNKDEMTAAAREKTQNLLETETLRVRSQASADSLMSLGLDAEQTIREARKIEDAALRDEVVSRVKVRLDERAAFAKTEKANLMRQVADYIDEFGTVDGVPAEIWSSLSVSERSSFRAYAKKGSSDVETDWNIYYDLSQMKANNPSQFLQEDLSKYLGKLGKAEVKQVMAWQRELDEAGSSASKDNWLQTKNSIVSDALTAMGVGYGKAASKKDSKEASRFRGAVENHLTLWQQNNPGKAIAPDEFRRMVERLTIEVTLPDSGFMGRDRTMPLFEVESSPDWYFSGDIDDVPEVDRRQIEEVITGRGQVPTEDLIVRYYMAKHDLRSAPSDD